MKNECLWGVNIEFKISMRKVKSLLKQTTPLQICSAPFVTVAIKFSCCSSRSLSPFFLLSLAGLPPTFFFCSSSIFQICGRDNQSKLNTLDNADTETISASVFVFIDSLVVSALQDAGGYAISRQNNLELHLGCHTCWLTYFTLVCLWCGRTVARSVYGHVITKFSRMGRILHFLPMVLRWQASLARAPL